MQQSTEALKNDRKPTAGYPSQRSAILGLHAEGVDAKDIAVKLAVSINVVRSRITEVKKARMAHAPESTPRAGSGRPATDFLLNYDVVVRLRPHARRRDLSVRALAQTIVEAAVERGLVDTILASYDRETSDAV